MHHAGEVVEARGEEWVIASSEAFGTCTVCTLEGVGPNSGRRVKLVEPFDRIRTLRRNRLRHASRSHVLRLARVAIAGARPTDGLWAAADARITLLPYQLEPALSVLAGSTRLLLADAVGLGKTVQAGLILSELRARGLANRALVVTPAGLRHAWANELRDRFGLGATIVDQSAITTQSWLTAADVNPWTCHDIIVASIDFVKRPDVLPSVEAAPFDVLIADETHHLTPGSDRGAAVDRLCKRAIWVVLVSATPHSGDDAAFAYLRALGAQGDRLAIFRRTRSDVGMPQSRRTCLLAVTPTSEERAMFDALDRYTTAIWQGRGRVERSAQLVATTLRRRAASSPQALARTLVRRRACLSDQVDPHETQPALPWEETEQGDDELDVVLRAPGLDDPIEERRWLDRLVGLTQSALESPSKLRRVLRIVACVREPIVIFTEYRDTLEALASALGRVMPVDVIHGAVPVERRRESIDRFTTGESNVLLATDAAGEGLNLQPRCRLVVNMELPWNPLRLEQRIGRVDRIGQTRRVHAMHLFHRDTVEDTVLARLERRRLRAAAVLDDIANDWLSERDVASTVFGDAPSEPRTPPQLPSHRISRVVDEVKRLEQQRRWRHPMAARQRPVWTSPRPGRSSSVVWLVETRHGGSSGLTIEQRVDAVVLDLAWTSFSRREWCQLIRGLDRLGLVSDRLDARERERLREIEPALRSFRTAVLDRLQRIRTELGRSQSRQWQRSLFDRRVERDEERRIATLNALHRHVARKVELVAGLTASQERRQQRLIAVWPFDSAVHERERLAQDKPFDSAVHERERLAQDKPFDSAVHERERLAQDKPFDSAARTRGGFAHPSTGLGMTLRLSKGQDKPFDVGGLRDRPFDSAARRRARFAQDKP